ncbi:carboxy-S-adenosyl-L-methionine synthase CmoA [Methylococcus geothermalis]|uniref:Carboxy-S-adenosyl-L-methionine synthase n=1 Tax=Methylococcus geothermalis TaxID=2681310 RepID=A0A858QBD5_9GAMM|nr:carboxy-S-adenosyl-L-methionine synthase CmoA [Methylococcus geothermalis]QJD31014.1 carboxy-S-adenosyl-L-methionine synthase CmoA [Methylococcus geothermalis]
MSKDDIYRQSKSFIDDFDFGENVATVFDDMLERSVPFYRELQRMIAEMAVDFAAPDTRIYDFGCSTGTTLIGLDRAIGPRRLTLVGVDNSEEMLAKCRAKMAGHAFSNAVELVRADLNQGIAMDDATLAVMILTLQFVRPLYRDRLVKTIHEGLEQNGALILVEKVLGESSLFNRSFIHYYYEFKKRNGYTELEIAQKREALENVLVPYKLAENLEMLRVAGFRYIDVFFKWYNFVGIVAVK